MTEEGKKLGIAFGAIATSVAILALIIGAFAKPEPKRGRI